MRLSQPLRRRLVGTFEGLTGHFIVVDSDTEVIDARRCRATRGKIFIAGNDRGAGINTQELGRIDQESRDDRAQVTAAQPEGKCDLPTGDRNDPTRVPGLVDSTIGIALAMDAESVGDSLQSGAPAHGVGPGCSRSACRRGTARRGATPASLGARAVVRACSVLGGLHREYSLATALARASICASHRSQKSGRDVERGPHM
jgi:hypothetical protein